MELNRNTVIITILSIIGIFALLFGVYSLSNKPQSKPQQDIPETRTIKASDHIKWSKDKKVVLTEYADMQCPACRNFNDILGSMETSAADKDIVSKVTFVYRHYPLRQVHKNAHAAALVAQAAAEQGKFFEAVDALYDSQADWEKASNPKLEDYLKDLKLDLKKLASDKNSQKVKDAVAENIASGNRVGVQGTPAFFLNGKKIEVSSIDDFKKQLRQATNPK